MAQTQKREPKIALWLGLGFLAVAAVIFYIAYHVIFPSDDSDKPFGGAKVKKQEIWAADGLKVSAEELGMVSSRSWDREAVYLKVQNSGSSEKVLRCTALSVNGVAVQPELAAEIPAGQTVTVPVLLDRSSLYYMQVYTVGTISMELAAFDPASMSQTARSGMITLQTNKVKKADTPQCLLDTDIFYDAGGIRIGTAELSVAYSQSSSAMRFYVENDSSEDVQIIPKEVRVNGKPYEVARKNADGSVYDDRGVGEGYVFPAGTKGTFYYELEWEPLDDVLPLDNVTGVCRIYDNGSGELLEEAEFTYRQ